jgi:hypothetical protein
MNIGSAPPDGCRSLAALPKHSSRLTPSRVRPGPLGADRLTFAGFVYTFTGIAAAAAFLFIFFMPETRPPAGGAVDQDGEVPHGGGR